MTSLGQLTLGEDFFSRLWLREPSSTVVGAETDSMFMWMWWFCVIWFVVLMGLMFFWVVKYRRRKGKIAPISAAHHPVLEIAWTVIPSLFLVYIFFRGFHGWIDKIVAPGDSMELRINGARWFWQLQYPNGSESPATTKIGAKEIPVFYVPAERDIRFKMQSVDVMHALWVPDFRIKQDLWPNRYSQVWFNALPPGDDAKRHIVVSSDSPDEVALALSGVPYKDHWIFCAEYCGDEHSEMAAILRVVPEDAYNRWLKAITSSGTPVERGERIYKTKCASCHTTDGGKNTGPSWKNIWGHKADLSDGTTVLVDHAYVRESVLNPQAKIVKGFEGQNMTSFAGLLSDPEIDAVIEFMKTKSDADVPAEAPGKAPPAPATAPARGPAAPGSTSAPAPK